MHLYMKRDSKGFIEDISNYPNDEIYELIPSDINKTEDKNTKTVCIVCHRQEIVYSEEIDESGHLKIIPVFVPEKENLVRIKGIFTTRAEAEKVWKGRQYNFDITNIIDEGIESMFQFKEKYYI